MRAIGKNNTIDFSPPFYPSRLLREGISLVPHMKESALQQQNSISSGRSADGVALLSSCRNLRVIADVRNSGNLLLDAERMATRV